MNNIVNLNTRRKDKMNKNTLVSKLEEQPGKSYTITQAEDLAKDVLKICGYDKLVGAIPIIKVANNFGFRCVKATVPEHISGNIFVGGTTENIYKSDKVIVVGDNEDPKHQRFIIAHELAHYLMDYIGSDKSKNPNLLFSETYLKENHDNDKEMRADRFAAELLMPSMIFLKQFLKVAEACDYNRNYIISYLSNFFKTKKSSIERRIIEVLS